ncbi:tRNA (cytosine(32)/uridine(32)-2'-O)-methyltransferase TrmJ [Paraferrimonas sedimenticola]|uniref:tRNA (cytidine/uridine-2'-O-)-methyltransferase TrmJ n=1 Tax=Paraferrimonas sedimenticola TaxID=375674 RepID=A0AA37VT41_9GAMM|nr:tRNA (cytosine(32)/uridine(32)-2'-O)-methyltransferase TrmJ [Paraferrimonas sedimenticola]GLP95184.1 tRNA (cytidine/uridine-2'-O-)-methyltransferase TrmJ [Paraferrimonas sedimenticola]
MLAQVKVVLVGTTHPGNIGSAARAMKTMGLSQLVLVDPQTEIDGKAVALAAGASDILQNVQIVDTLEQAVADCRLVVATSARRRGLDWPMLEPRGAGEKLAAQAHSAPVAVVFGRERSGLSNSELQLAQYHLAIPANPEYSSLNLAQAVQIISYEVRMASLALEQAKPELDETEYPSGEDLERFYEHLQSTLNTTGFIVQAHPGQIMAKLRRLFTKARPEVPEMNILRGILSSVEKAIKRAESKSSNR